MIGDVYDSYDAVSDLLVAESVHQAAVGNLDRSGAALSAHDRHGRAPDLDYVSAPQSGHTVAHRVAVAMQSHTLPAGWRRDTRGAAEPMLDAWIARLLGRARRLAVRRRRACARRHRDAARAGVACRSPPGRPLGRAGNAEDGPGVAQRARAAHRARLRGPDGRQLGRRARCCSQTRPLPDATGGLALLETLGDWLAKLSAASPLTAGDLRSSADVGGAIGSSRDDRSSPSSRLGWRPHGTALSTVIDALRGADDRHQRARERFSTLSSSTVPTRCLRCPPTILTPLPCSAPRSTR